MKKALTLILAIFLVVAFVGCSGKEENQHIEFPFDVKEIQSIEVYHRSSELTSCELIVVTEAKDIKKIYKEFDALPLEDYDKEESIVGTEALSIRINLVDGTEFDIVFVGHENGGYLSYTSGDAQYFTSQNVCSSWSKLTEKYSVETIGVDEMP